MCRGRCVKAKSTPRHAIGIRAALHERADYFRAQTGEQLRNRHIWNLGEQLKGEMDFTRTGLPKGAIDEVEGMSMPAQYSPEVP